MNKENYTWLQFQAAVLGLCGVDSDREGISTFRTNQIRQAVIELQGLIPQYQNSHETLYLPSDCVYDGLASKGAKPPESILKELWLCQVQRDSSKRTTGKAFKHQLKPWPWKDRESLIEGRAAVNDGMGWYTVDPEGCEFYVFPAVYDDWLLSMRWNGKKLDFKDDEETPFDEPLAGTVALKVKAEISREVEQNVQLHQSYEMSFDKKKRSLWRDKREQAVG